MQRPAHPRKKHKSYPDSPNIPQFPMPGRLHHSIIPGLREEEDEMTYDSLGISYGPGREKTRHLKSYPQNQISKSATRRSTSASESMDSRFESAVGSSQSLRRFDIPEDAHHCNVDTQGDSVYGMRTSLSDSDSWETQHTHRDSEGRAIEYTDEESPKLVMARTAVRGSKVSSIPRDSRGVPVEEDGGFDSSLGSSRGPYNDDEMDEMEDMDYTAYV